MARKKSESSARGKRVGASVVYRPDEDIDFSDIPELTDEQLRQGIEDRRRRLAGRPPSGLPWKTLISMRIEPTLLAEIRKVAAKSNKPYQTWIHETLERAIKRKRSA